MLDMINDHMERGVMLCPFEFMKKSTLANASGGKRKECQEFPQQVSEKGWESLCSRRERRKDSYDVWVERSGTGSARVGDHWTATTRMMAKTIRIPPRIIH